MRRRVFTCAFAVLLTGLCWVGLWAADDASFSGPYHGTTIEGPPRRETSGLALSRRTPGVIWTHDDSGGAAQLYADDLKTGKRRGTVRVTGHRNEDWEDLAAFELDGKAWLVIGDVGDNDGRRKVVRLLVLPEPSTADLQPHAVFDVKPAYVVPVRFPDGPRDCEGIAVDPVEGAIYLLTKRDKTPRLYRVPLADPGSRVIEAQFVTEVPGISGGPRPDSLIKRLAGARFSWPTALDFAPDGRAAAVVTYGETLVFARGAGEAWSEVFQRAPDRLGFHGFPQAEAVGFSADGRSIYVASEDTNQVLRFGRETR